MRVNNTCTLLAIIIIVGYVYGFVKYFCHLVILNGKVYHLFIFLIKIVQMKWGLSWADGSL